MPRTRAAVTLITILAGAGWPDGALAATPPVPRLSSTPPPWLAPAAGLPNTGSDVRIETILALGLLAAGGALRRRRTP
jgi:LPXTG-motif cell wall-anchored protein